MKELAVSMFSHVTHVFAMLIAMLSAVLSMQYPCSTLTMITTL